MTRYDDDGRMTEEALTIQDDGTGGTTNANGHAPLPYDDVFKFDLANNRVEEDTTGGVDGNGVILYTYNSDDQLLKETRTRTHSYATAPAPAPAPASSKATTPPAT